MLPHISTCNLDSLPSSFPLPLLPFSHKVLIQPVTAPHQSNTATMVCDSALTGQWQTCHPDSLSQTASPEYGRRQTGLNRHNSFPSSAKLVGAWLCDPTFSASSLSFFEAPACQCGSHHPHLMIQMSSTLCLSNVVFSPVTRYFSSMVHGPSKSTIISWSSEYATCKYVTFLPWADIRKKLKTERIHASKLSAAAGADFQVD